jgi:hypothetical protein
MTVGRVRWQEGNGRREDTRGRVDELDDDGNHREQPFISLGCCRCCLRIDCCQTSGPSFQIECVIRSIRVGNMSYTNGSSVRRPTYTNSSKTASVPPSQQRPINSQQQPSYSHAQNHYINDEQPYYSNEQSVPVHQTNVDHRRTGGVGHLALSTRVFIELAELFPLAHKRRSSTLIDRCCSLVFLDSLSNNAQRTTNSISLIELLVN